MMDFYVPILINNKGCYESVHYCSDMCMDIHYPPLYETQICEMCYGVFPENKMLKCANCAIVFCETCREIPMNFEVPVLVRGRPGFEKGYYCTDKCMRTHHPGFV